MDQAHQKVRCLDWEALEAVDFPMDFQIVAFDPFYPGIRNTLDCQRTQAEEAHSSVADAFALWEAVD